MTEILDWFLKPKKERKMSQNSALKVIDHALSGKEGIENCEKFVEILGLRTLFPLFMKTPKRNKKSGHTENVSRLTIVRVSMRLKKIFQKFLWYSCGRRKFCFWLGFPRKIRKFSSSFYSEGFLVGHEFFSLTRGNLSHEKFRKNSLDRLKTLTISNFQNFLGTRGNPIYS